MDEYNQNPDNDKDNNNDNGKREGGIIHWVEQEKIRYDNSLEDFWYN